jgi:hypothetical protein
VQSTKKGQDKFGKTIKKLPDLMMTGMNQNENFGGRNIGFASDSETDPNGLKQLPMIKGGAHPHQSS